MPAPTIGGRKGLIRLLARATVALQVRLGRRIASPAVVSVVIWLASLPPFILVNRFLHSRAAVGITFGLLVVEVLFVSMSVLGMNGRAAVVDYITNDLDAQVKRVEPARASREFANYVSAKDKQPVLSTSNPLVDAVRSDDDSGLLIENTLRRIMRTPGGLWASGKYIASQGIVGAVVLVIPLGLTAASFRGAPKSSLLNPLAWGYVLLIVAGFGFAVQFGIEFLILVFKFTLGCLGGIKIAEMLASLPDRVMAIAADWERAGDPSPMAALDAASEAGAF